MNVTITRTSRDFNTTFRTQIMEEQQMKSVTDLEKRGHFVDLEEAFDDVQREDNGTEVRTYRIEKGRERGGSYRCHVNTENWQRNLRRR